MRRMLRRWISATAVGTLLVAVGVSPALASYRTGSVTCGGAREAIVQSQASVWISHSWSNGGYQSFYNPYRTLRTSFTGMQATWWVVEYDFEITPAGGSCTQ